MVKMVKMGSFDEEGDYHGWQMDYDSSKSDEMTVYLGSRANTDYMEQEQLSPMFEMIDFLISDGNTSMLESFGFQIPASDEETDGEMCLRRRRTEKICQIWEQKKGLFYASLQRTNGDIDGFLLSLYRDDTKILTMVTGVGTLETVAEIQKREEEEERLEEVEAAKQAGKTLVRDGDGMTFYLDENTSMQLTVVDAAAGSRWYSFENGSIYNEVPFNGRWDVAESIYFLDEKTGFILLCYASQNSSYIYYTSDGGETFEEVLLPVGDGEEDMKGNAFDFTPEDMDYVYTPYEEDGILYVKVSSDSASEVYMYLLFSSEDAGASWQYVSFQDDYGESYE